MKNVPVKMRLTKTGISKTTSITSRCIIWKLGFGCDQKVINYSDKTANSAQLSWGLLSCGFSHN